MKSHEPRHPVTRRHLIVTALGAGGGSLAFGGLRSALPGAAAQDQAADQTADEIATTPVASDPDAATAGFPGADRSLFLPEPPTRFSVNGLLATQLEARPEPTLGAGRLSYEGSQGGLPGPTIRLRPGDTLRVRLINNLGGGITNLHVHGLHVSPLGNGDNVFLHIDDGESFDYEFTLPPDHQPGLFWYHPHYHGDSMQQVGDGLAGAIVVEGGLDDLPVIRDIPQRLMVLQGPFFGVGGAEYPVNGVANPNLAIRPGQTQRWRLLNASANAFFNLVLDGHSFYRLAIDGNPLPQVIQSSQFLLGPGERADFLVQGGPAGSYALRSLAWGTDAQAQPETILATMSSGGDPVPPLPLPTTLIPLGARLPDLTNATIDVRREIVFQENNAAPYFAINGQAFDADRIDQTVRLGATEEWAISNTSPDWHPFHIHVNDFQIMTFNGEPVDPHYEDTVSVPPGGTVVIRTRFLDFVGKFVYHCHILAHEDAGMMGTVEVVK